MQPLMLVQAWHILLQDITAHFSIQWLAYVEMSRSVQDLHPHITQ